MTSRVLPHTNSASDNSDSEGGLSDQEMQGGHLRVSGGKDSGYRWGLEKLNKAFSFYFSSDLDSSGGAVSPGSQREEVLPVVAASYRNILKQVGRGE